MKKDTGMAKFVRARTSKQRNDERALCKMACSERQSPLTETHARFGIKKESCVRIGRTVQDAASAAFLCLGDATRSLNELRVPSVRTQNEARQVRVGQVSLRN